MAWHMNFCIYRVYICLSANIDQLEIKLQKRKAEKNKNQKKKRKLTFLGNFPFRPYLFRHFPLSAWARVSSPACALSLPLYFSDEPVPHVSSFLHSSTFLRATASSPALPRTAESDHLPCPGVALACAEPCRPHPQGNPLLSPRSPGEFESISGTIRIDFR